MVDAINELIDCPICGVKTFNGSYDHMFFVKDKKVTCSGVINA